MKIKVLGIRIADYERLVASCDKNTPEYECLINAFVRRNNGQEEVGVPVDNAGLDLILKLALSKCPEIISAIRMLERWDSDWSSESTHQPISRARVIHAR